MVVVVDVGVVGVLVGVEGVVVGGVVVGVAWVPGLLTVAGNLAKKFMRFWNTSRSRSSTVLRSDGACEVVALSNLSKLATKLNLSIVLDVFFAVVVAVNVNRFGSSVLFAIHRSPDPFGVPVVLLTFISGNMEEMRLFVAAMR